MSVSNSLKFSSLRSERILDRETCHLGITGYQGYMMSTVEDVQCHGGYHDKCREYLEYRGGFQYHGGYHDTCGGYHEYRMGVQYCGGTQISKNDSPTVLNTPPWYSWYPPRYCTHIIHDGFWPERAL